MIEVKDIAPAIAELKSAAFSRLDKVDQQQAEVKERLCEVEQKLDSRKQGGGNGNDASAGDFLGPLLEKSAGFQALREKSTTGCRIALPANTFSSKATLLGTDNGVHAPLVTVHRLPGIGVAPQRRLTMRDLLTTLPLAEAGVEYLEEGAFINNWLTTITLSGRRQLSWPVETAAGQAREAGLP